MRRAALIVLGVLVAASLSPAVVLVLSPWLGVNPDTLQGNDFEVTLQNLLLVFAVGAVTIVTPLAATRWLHGFSMADLGFRRGFLWNFISGHLLGLAMVGTVLFISYLACDRATLVWAVPADVSAATLVIHYLFFWVALLTLTSFKEELLYRAYPMEISLRTGNSTVVAVIASATIFALVHLILEPPTWMGFANRFAFGLLACQLYALTRSIWAPIGLHNGWNWALSTFGGNWQLGGLWDLTLDPEPAWTSYLMLAVTAGAAVLLAMLWRWSATISAWNSRR